MFRQKTSPRGNGKSAQYYREYYWANRDRITRQIRERKQAKAAKVRGQVEAAFTGRRFGALVTLYPLVRTNKHLGGWWLCRCDCGGEIEAWTYKLKRGVKTSCGCHIHARQKRNRLIRSLCPLA